MPTLNKSDSPYLGPLLTTKPTILWIHDPISSFSQDAVINPEAFPTINDGQLLRLHFLNNNSNNNNNNHNNNTTVELEPLIVKISLAERESIGRLHHLQVSHIYKYINILSTYLETFMLIDKLFINILLFFFLKKNALLDLHFKRYC